MCSEDKTQAPSNESMKRRAILVMIIFNLLLFTSFDCVLDRRYHVFMKNTASHPIKYFLAFGDKGKGVYPDTSLLGTRPLLGEISSDKSIMVFDSGVKISQLFASLPADTLSIFIFHPDTFDYCTWEAIAQDYKVLKRYDLSYKDLKLLDEVIYYPPISKMEKMQIYP